MFAIALLSVASVPFAKRLGSFHRAGLRSKVIPFLVVLYLIASLFNRVTFPAGIPISLFEVVALVLMGAVAVNLLVRKGRRAGLLELVLPRHMGWVYIFFGYAFIGLLVGAAFAPSYNLTNPSINNHWVIRPIIQSASLMSAFVAASLVYRLAVSKGSNSSWTLLRAFYAGVTLSLAIAFVQLAFWAVGHPEWFLVPSTDEGASRQPGDDFTSIIRLSSWAGEPKTFANNLLVLLPLWLYSSRRLVRRLVPMRRVVPIWGALAFVLAFSVSAIMAFAVIISSTAVLVNGRKRLIVRLAVMGLVTALLGTAILRSLGSGTDPSLLYGRASQSLQKIFEGDSRVEKPITVMGIDIYMDANEQPVLAMLQDRPEYLLFGVGWGNTTFYVRPYIDEFLGAGTTEVMQQVFRPNMALLRYGADLGLVGMGILLWGIVQLLLRARRLSKVSPTESKFLMSLILVVAASFLIHPASYSQFVVLLLIAAHTDNGLNPSSPYDQVSVDDRVVA